jgi:uncharacterized protein YkwD
MIRKLVTSLILVLTFVPAGVASAEPGDITKPAAVLQSALRTGHRVPIANLPTVTAPPKAPAAPQLPREILDVIDLVNVERVAHGLVAVRSSSELNRAALDHTRKQADDGQIYHVDPDDGSNPGERISRTGYTFSAWGENVAAGYRTAQDVMKGWMDSPGHCRNILNPGFTEIGVGYVTGGAVFGTFWTQAFARPADEPRPAGTFVDAWC